MHTRTHSHPVWEQQTSTATVVTGDDSPPRGVCFAYYRTGECGNRDRCIYAHLQASNLDQECSYGPLCTRENCWYRHSETVVTIDSNASFGSAGGASSPAGGSKQMCRFGAKCNRRATCRYNHACRYAAACNDPICAFEHPPRNDSESGSHTSTAGYALGWVVGT